MNTPTPSEVCRAIAQEHADGVRSLRSRRASSDGETGVSEVVGGYRDRDGALRVIAVRRSGRDRYDVVDVAAGEESRVLASVYGTDPAAEEHAFRVAAERLAAAKRSA